MLQGTLDDFDLRFIFRFLSLTQKTGKLTVAGPKGSGRVYFRGGEIYHAESDLRREGFGRKLVKAGKLSVEQLGATLEYCATSGKGLGEGLVDKRLVTPHDLEGALRAEIEEVVLGLFHNEVGRFSFAPDEQVESDTLILVPVESLIEEDSVSFRARVPLLNQAFVKASIATGGDMRVSVSTEEWSVIASIDGRRTVGDICEHLGRSEFSVMRSIRRLMSLGLVTVPDGRAEGLVTDHETSVAQSEQRPAQGPGRPRRAPPPPPPPAKVVAPGEQESVWGREDK